MEHIKRKKQKNNQFYSITIIIGVSLLTLGFIFYGYNYYQKKTNDKIEEKSIEKYFEIEEETSIVGESKEEHPIIKKDDEIYIGVLEIPKINLKKGLVDKTSPKNNVNKNIYLLKETILPDEQAISHILLAAHSGNSYVSFFKNLRKLEITDKVYFYYKGMKYIYEIFDKYEIEKTGVAKLNQTNMSDITLITCISGTNKQIIYIAKLIDEEKY